MNDDRINRYNVLSKLFEGAEPCLERNPKGNKFSLKLKNKNLQK